MMKTLFLSYLHNNNNHVMVLVAMFELDFCLSAMVLWNDGHKSIYKFFNLSYSPLESLLLLTPLRSSLSNQSDGERSPRTQQQQEPAWSTDTTTTKP
jgi:hypothetical protein